MAPTAVPRLRYFVLPGLAGRGGAVRFFFLAVDQPYEDQLESLADWGAGVKQKVAATDNVAGHLPVVYLEDQVLTEHHAIMRYFSRLRGLYGSDAVRDYLVDRLADATNEWRTQLLDAAFGSDEKKAKYRAEQRPELYRRFEALLALPGQPASVQAAQKPGFAVGDKMSFADALLFTVVWDDQGAFGPVEGGFEKQYPRLAALFKRFGELPGVAAWCAEHRK